MKEWAEERMRQKHQIYCYFTPPSMGCQIKGKNIKTRISFASNQVRPFFLANKNLFGFTLCIYVTNMMVPIAKVAVNKSSEERLD